MKDKEHIRVTYDGTNDAYVRATTYRAILEGFGLYVTLEPLREEKQLRTFFSAPTDACFTIVNCHGWGKTDDEAVICFQVARQINEVNWESYEFHMTPQNINSIVTAGSRTMLMNACWSGKSVFADAFLQAGYKHYIAPEKTSDNLSGQEFITVLIGGLIWEVRDWGRKNLSMREAVDRARGIDDFWDGANGFRLFEKETG